MDIRKTMLISVLAILLSSTILAQESVLIDTVRVNDLIYKASAFYEAGQVDSSFLYYDEAGKLTVALPYKSNKWAVNNHLFCLTKMNGIMLNKFMINEARILSDSIITLAGEVFGYYSNFSASGYNDKGIACFYSSELDSALANFSRCLSIRIIVYGEKSLLVANSYNNISLLYRAKAEFDKALDYCYKDLQIMTELYGGKHSSIANSYRNLSEIFIRKAQFDKAIEFETKSLDLYRELYGENNKEIASGYFNLGMIYNAKGEYDKALDYHFKNLAWENEQQVKDKHALAATYGEIGTIYSKKGEYDKALDYFFKSLEFRKELFGERHFEVAASYTNIGIIYNCKADYDKALEYHLKSLEISKEIYGEDHPDVSMSYDNIGSVYSNKKEYDKALEYFFRDLRILRKTLGQKHIYVADSYNNIGEMYRLKNDFIPALKYYQMAIAASLQSFNDTTDILKVPRINEVLYGNQLLLALRSKAEIFLNETDLKTDLPTDLSFHEIALKHFQAADTLITRIRRNLSSQSDKLSFGESAEKVYEGAICVSEILDAGSKKVKDKLRYSELSFYFSEQNKSIVLLEALTGIEGMKFIGIPDSIQNNEHRLKSDISLIEMEMAGATDSASCEIFRNKLFTANRQYEELIAEIGKGYPDYYNLKYSSKNPSIKEVQKLLDDKTALRSYFLGDSIIYMFTVTKGKLNIRQVPVIENLNDSITWFRYGLTNLSPRMKESYRRLGFKLYQQLFPDSTTFGKGITNLIIVPDGNLATIPFEALLTCKYEGDIADYPAYAYLLNKYNISYCSSVNFFYHTFSLKSSEKDQNYWLALAPVFNENMNRMMDLRTTTLQNQINDMQMDSLMHSRSFLDRNFISSLPATEVETKAILKLTESANKKARVLLFNDANEQFIKAGGLNGYKILHFATHGFVNSEHPELSAILLSPDSTGGQDGVLFSSEIFNLKLNADLVVLSACETGLGKIQKGEGIIGLTRAFLFAGARNLIVSLWQVADESTSDLMAGFYKYLLNSEGQIKYTYALRDAKLKMISEKKYAHPLFWSPFILIGN